MSKARQKGTAGENHFLAVLRQVWPWAERAPLKGINDHGDYVNVPWLHEAKNVNVPRFLQWARVARKKAAGGRWAILWQGDRRTEDGQPLVFMSPELYTELTGLWQDRYHYVPSQPHEAA